MADDVCVKLQDFESDCTTSTWGFEGSQLENTISHEVSNEIS